jgi:hypothetical protein
MTTFLVNLIDGVFRPSVAALAIVAGLVTFTIEHNPGPASLHATKLNSALCDSPLRPVCKAFTF